MNMEIIFLPLISIIVSISLVVAFENWGVLMAGAATGLASVWLTSVLIDFGKPNGGSSSSSLATAEIFKYFFIGLLLGLLVYYAINLIILRFRGHPSSQVLTIIWGSAIALIIVVYLARSMYLSNTENHVHVSFGYDNKLEFEYGGVEIKLTKGEKETLIPFTSSSYSKEVNRYGYQSDKSGSATMHFQPDNIHIAIKKYRPVTYHVNQVMKTVTFYLNKEGVLKIFINTQLEKTVQLVPAEE